MSRYYRVFDGQGESTGQVLIARNTQQPKMSNYGGAVWDRTNFCIDGERVVGWLDFMRGNCVYFERDGSWFKFRFHETGINGDLPFSNTEPHYDEVLGINEFTTTHDLVPVDKDTYDDYVERVHEDVVAGSEGEA